MSGSFISLAKECFPHATICIDNFHVVQRLTKVVTDVRRRLQNNFKNAGNDDNYNQLKNIRYALTTAKYNQWEKWGDRAAEKAQCLLDAFIVAPELEEAYEAYQDFLLILASSPFSVQREELINWFHTYQHTEVPDLKTALYTLRSLRTYILNAWKHERSNGTCEGLNKKIKDVKGSMYGAHSFENLRKRILLSCCSPNILKDQLFLHLDSKKGGK